MSETLAQLQEIFRRVFGDEEISLNDQTNAKDIDGWDSMMTINLMIAIEKRFKIKFAAAEVAVGLALIVALYRKRQSAHVEDLTSMKL